MNHCELISFLKNTIFFTCERREKSGGGEGSKYKSKVEDRLKLTDNIFCLSHVYIYPKNRAGEGGAGSLTLSSRFTFAFFRIYKRVIGKNVIS